MDFFDSIEEYEKKMERNVKEKLELMLSMMYESKHKKEDKKIEHNANLKEHQNEFIDEVNTSKKVSLLINQTVNNGKKKKYVINALNRKNKNSLLSCYNQNTININTTFYSQKNESDIVKKMINDSIIQKVKNDFKEEMSTSNYNKRIKAYKAIFPIKIKTVKPNKENTENTSIIGKDNSVLQEDWKIPNYQLRKNIKIHFPKKNKSPDKKAIEQRAPETKSNFYCLKLKLNNNPNREEIKNKNNSNKNNNSNIGNLFMINCKQKRILSSRMRITGRELK